MYDISSDFLRCPNHTQKSVLSTTTEPEAITKPSEASRSFVTVESPLANYCFLQGHLTVLLCLDRTEMAVSIRPLTHTIQRHQEDSQERRHSDSEGPNDELSLQSQSQSVPPSPSSYPMGVTETNFVCRIGCYTSCLGGQVRGAVELVFRLEEIPRYLPK